MTPLPTSCQHNVIPFRHKNPLPCLLISFKVKTSILQCFFTQPPPGTLQPQDFALSLFPPKSPLPLATYVLLSLGFTGHLPLRPPHRPGSLLDTAAPSRAGLHSQPWPHSFSFSHNTGHPQPAITVSSMILRLLSSLSHCSISQENTFPFLAGLAPVATESRAQPKPQHHEGLRTEGCWQGDRGLPGGWQVREPGPVPAHPTLAGIPQR